jgi:hypothetical protein
MLDDLKELLGREPFTPFRIVLTSGSTYDVGSPLQVAVGKTQLNYYPPKSDRWAILRLNQIASFEVGEPERRSGKRSRRGGK